MVSRSIYTTVVAAALFVAPAFAAEDLTNAPPPAPYAKVSKLVALPDFIPGLGTLYVDPATLPAGPFLGYDHLGKLAATVYMTPIDQLKDGKAFEDLKLGNANVTSVEVYYNAGHPAVEKPHIHIVLLHGPDAEARLAK